MQKTCTTCNLVKGVGDFPITKSKNGQSYLRSKCKSCTSRDNCNKLYVKNKLLYTCKHKICSSCKKSKLAVDENFSKRKGKKGSYFISKCRDCMIEYQNTYKVTRNHNERIRRKLDPSYRIRQYVSISVKDHLIDNLSSKNGQSILDHLPYTIDDLRLHLESLFEPWMNWDNHGRYLLSTWNDNDESTWTWQIDHIIPHVNFPYISLNDDYFINCWSLSNLRPLSSKQNIIEKDRK